MKIKIRKTIYWFFWGMLSLVILLAAINPKAALLMLLGYKYSSCAITAVSDGKNFSREFRKTDRSYLSSLQQTICFSLYLFKLYIKKTKGLKFKRISPENQVNCILRMYLPKWKYDFVLSEIIRFCKKTGTKHVMLFTDAQIMVWIRMTDSFSTNLFKKGFPLLDKLLFYSTLFEHTFV